MTAELKLVVSCDYVERDLIRCDAKLILDNVTTFNLAKRVNQTGWGSYFGMFRCPEHVIGE